MEKTKTLNNDTFTGCKIFSNNIHIDSVRDDYLTDDSNSDNESFDSAFDDDSSIDTIDDAFGAVDIEWITTAITRILSDDNNDDADDEHSSNGKLAKHLHWKRLGLLSEAISQFIDDEDNDDFSTNSDLPMELPPLGLIHSSSDDTFQFLNKTSCISEEDLQGAISNSQRIRLKTM